MSTIRHLLDRNRAWATSVEATHPGFFRGLARSRRSREAVAEVGGALKAALA